MDARTSQSKIDLCIYLNEQLLLELKKTIPEVFAKLSSRIYIRHGISTALGIYVYYYLFWGVNPTSLPRGTPWGTVLLALSNERGSGCGRQ